MTGRLNGLLNHLKDPLVKGHPLHAMLTDAPIGALVVGLTCDGAGIITRRPAWRFSARAAYTTAFASGAVAALVGLWDYQAVPREHPARRIGALHGYLNAGMLTLLLGSLLLRRDSQAPASGRPSPAAVALAAATLAMLGASGWLGGELVFRLGWRVVPAEHAEQIEEALRQRGENTLVERAHSTVRQYEQEHALLP